MDSNTKRRRLASKEEKKISVYDAYELQKTLKRKMPKKKAKS
jgi:hypothetical protein